MALEVHIKETENERNTSVPLSCVDQEAMGSIMALYREYLSPIVPILLLTYLVTSYYSWKHVEDNGCQLFLQIYLKRLH